MTDTDPGPGCTLTRPKKTYCEQSQKDFENRKDAKTMTVEERAIALEEMVEKSIVTIPFGNIHQRIEELVGRPVWTHEMGTSGMKHLIEEIRSSKTATPDDIIGKIVHKNPIVVVCDEKRKDTNN